MLRKLRPYARRTKQTSKKANMQMCIGNQTRLIALRLRTKIKTALTNKKMATADDGGTDLIGRVGRPVSVFCERSA